MKWSCPPGTERPLPAGVTHYPPQPHLFHCQLARPPGIAPEPSPRLPLVRVVLQTALLSRVMRTMNISQSIYQGWRASAWKTLQWSNTENSNSKEKVGRRCWKQNIRRLNGVFFNIFKNKVMQEKQTVGGIGGVWPGKSWRWSSWPCHPALCQQDLPATAPLLGHQRHQSLPADSSSHLLTALPRPHGSAPTRALSPPTTAKTQHLPPMK